MAKLGERIRALRTEQDKTQQEIADFLGVHCMTVSGWERGTRKPNFEYIDALADFFDVNMEYLTGSSDTRERYPRHSDQSFRLSQEESEILGRYRAASDEIRAAVRAVLGLK